MKKTILVVLFAVACGGKSKPETTSAPPTDPNAPVSNSDPSAAGAGSGEGTGCEKEIAMVCPDGQIDACLKTPQEGTVHKCVVK
jgi:hypothetical protein